MVVVYTRVVEFLLYRSVQRGRLEVYLSNMANHSPGYTRPSLRTVLYVACTALFIIVVLLRVGGAEASLAQLKSADLLLVSLATLMVVLSYVCSALSYKVLSQHPLRLWPTLAVQFATGFTNRLLPAGIGGLGLYALYYRRNGHSLTDASAVVVSNNVWGVVGNILLLAVLLIVRPEYLGELRLPTVSAGTAAVIAAVVAVVAAASLYASRGRAGRFRTSLRSLGTAFRTTLRPRRAAYLAVLANMALTSLLATTLLLSLLAIGSDVSWGAALIAVSAGTLVGVSVPTPGGLGGMEAGLFAVLVGFGVPAAAAAAGVLLYRGLTYWLPIVPGIFLFRYVLRRYV